MKHTPSTLPQSWEAWLPSPECSLAVLSGIGMSGAFGLGAARKNLTAFALGEVIQLLHGFHIHSWYLQS
jgi:hypothetical protein